MRKLLNPLALLALVVLLGACERLFSPPLAGFRELGELRVAIRDDGLAFRDAGNNTLEGLEHDLLQELGKRLGVPVRFIRYPDVTRMLGAVAEGRVHLAAGSIAELPHPGLQWSPPLRREEFVLAAAEDGPPLRQEADLAGRSIGVRRGSPAAASLQAMATRVKGLKVVLYADSSDRPLLERMRRGTVDLVATDRSQLALLQGLYPDMEERLDLAVGEEIRWALRSDAADNLRQELGDFLAWAEHSRLLARTHDRYLGALKRLGAADIDAFLLRLRERLPPLMPHFHEAQEITGIDWRFLAALAYQESQWDPLARSFTGVRGIMMLTEETADHLGVDNRLDPRQSILGGARYYSSLLEQFDEVAEPDRSWIAIASYNLGPGHMNGARSIARRMGHNPDAWIELRTVLPLLSRPSFAARLGGRTARGGEAVVMTENVRGYYALLSRMEAPYTPPLTPRVSLAEGQTNGGAGGLTYPRSGGRLSAPPM